MDSIGYTLMGEQAGPRTTVTPGTGRPVALLRTRPCSVTPGGASCARKVSVKIAPTASSCPSTECRVTAEVSNAHTPITYPWLVVVAAEFMGASEGLGYLLTDGQQLGKPAQIVAAIVIFAILGKTTDWLIEIATAPLLRWQDAFGRQSGAA